MHDCAVDRMTANGAVDVHDACAALCACAGSFGSWPCAAQGVLFRAISVAITQQLPASLQFTTLRQWLLPELLKPPAAAMEGWEPKQVKP